MGHPVVGDPLYDGRDGCLNRVAPLMKDVAAKVLEIAPAQLLQAVKIELIHPTTGKKMKFKVPLEKPFEQVLKLLKKECPADAPVFDNEVLPRLVKSPYKTSTTVSACALRTRTSLPSRTAATRFSRT